MQDTGEKVLEEQLEKREELALELRRIREELSKVHGTRKLQMLLDSPSPKAVIQDMPPQELLYTFKDIGLVDTAELVQLATREQITYCLDLDCWEKDKFNIKKFEEWLQYLPAREFEAVEKVLSAIEPELLVFYYRNMFNIEHHEGDDAKTVKDNKEDPVGDFIQTPDGFYVVHIPFEAEDHRGMLARLSLDLFQQYGYEFCHKLFESIRHSLPSELEEISYRFHTARLADLGFIDYYEAIGLYQELPRHTKPMPPSLPLERSKLPIIGQSHIKGIFGKSINAIEDPAIKERIHFELLYLTNKIISADQVEIANPRAISKTLNFVQRMMNIALDFMADNELEKSVILLQNHHLEWIFRNGFSLLAKMRKRTQRILKDKRYTLAELPHLTLLGSPYLQLVNALKQKKPKFYSGFDEIATESYRPFRTLKDVEIAETALSYIEFLPRFFFEYLPFKYEQLQKLTANIIFPDDIKDIEYSHLFLTALAHFYLYQRFELEPLSAKEIQLFQNKIFIKEGEKPYPIDPTFKEKVLDALMKLPLNTSEEKNFLQRFLNDMWNKLYEEASYLSREQELDPRFISLFLISGSHLDV